MPKKKPQERAFRVFGPVVTVKMALQIKRGEVRSTSRAGILNDYSRHIRLDDGRVEPRAARVAEKDGLELPTTTLYVINLDKSNSKEAKIFMNASNIESKEKNYLDLYKITQKL